MSTKHTPGPWVAHGSYVKPTDTPLMMVAAVDHCPSKDANARLIAAAPDLLKALKEVEFRCEGREDIDDNGGPNLAMQIQQVIRTAIAKAEGESK